MIELSPMSVEAYQAFLGRIIPEYAADHVRSGNWTEAEALERSRLEFEKLLPNGLDTPRHYLFTLMNETGEAVGMVWYGFEEKKPQDAFIYEFEIFAPFRRRGYASQALAALDVKTWEQGFRRIDLHVFGFNIAARELYKKSGFLETNVNMSKEIPAPGGVSPK